MKYDMPTRLLHKAIALTVTVQVLLSFGMEHPKPGVVREALELQLFEIHEYNGLLALALLLVHLMYSLMSAGDSSWRALFPWLHKEGRAKLCGELGQLSSWMKQGLPHPDASHALASTVHGLGLLAAAMAGLLGACIYLGMAADGAVSEGIHDVMELHELFGMAVIAYLVLHVLATIMHQRQGHDVVSRIK